MPPKPKRLGGNDPLQPQEKPIIDPPLDTSPRAVEIAEMTRQALELRKAGLTYDEIAKNVGFNSPQTAHAHVAKALRELPMDGVMELRTLQIQRTHDLLKSVWRNAFNPKAMRPDDPSTVQSPSMHLAYVRQAQSLIRDLREIMGLDQDLPSEELMAEGAVFVESDDVIELLVAMKAKKVTGGDVEAWMRTRDSIETPSQPSNGSNGKKA